MRKRAWRDCTKKSAGSRTNLTTAISRSATSARAAASPGLAAQSHQGALRRTRSDVLRGHEQCHVCQGVRHHSHWNDGARISAGCQALGPRLRDSQTYGFEMWAKEYRGDLGIALSDVYGTEPFLRDFDMFFCKLFDGARHDSGDPESWGERMILHYAATNATREARR